MPHHIPADPKIAEYRTCMVGSEPERGVDHRLRQGGSRAGWCELAVGSSVIGDPDPDGLGEGARLVT